MNEILNDYDENNVFAKILNKSLPSDVVFENDYALAFKDINPQARIHILIIPKKKYRNIRELLDGDKDFLLNFMNSVNEVIKQINVNNDDFKLLTNNGKDADQEVFHMHFHLMIY